MLNRSSVSSAACLSCPSGTYNPSTGGSSLAAAFPVQPGRSIHIPEAHRLVYVCRPTIVRLAVLAKRLALPAPTAQALHNISKNVLSVITALL
jgi:hypothetical protein